MQASLLATAALTAEVAALKQGLDFGHGFCTYDNTAINIQCLSLPEHIASRSSPCFSWSRTLTAELVLGPLQPLPQFRDLGSMRGCGQQRRLLIHT